jgi:hypothetical protein
VTSSDRVLYRVDVSRQASNGYIDRGESNSTAVSASLAFLVSDRVNWQATALSRTTCSSLIRFSSRR